MKYFKNTELAKLYNISEKSVRNWVQAASEGKLDLELYETSGKLFVANTSKNTAQILQLVEKGKKFRNTRALKISHPTSELYRVYSQKQIYDIIANLDIYREIPYEYSYFNGGATRWDAYTSKLLAERTSNPITNTIELLDLNLDYIDTLVKGFANVNVVDVGVGNCLPIRNLLQHFLSKGTLKRYIGIDISSDMLNIAERNIKEWFDGKVNFEGYVKDINYDRFNDLLVADSFTDSEGPTINLVLFLGGTISNLRDPNRALSTIHESMSKTDLLIFTKKPDTSNSRRYFDFVSETSNSKTPFDFQTFRGKTVVEYLGIDEDFYEVEQFFDKENRVRKVHIKLKVALSIEFKVEGKMRAVEFDKGESILLWRAQHQDTLEIIQQFNDNDFDILELMKTNDKEYLMLITKIMVTQKIA